MSKITFPYIEDYLELLAGLRDASGRLLVGIFPQSAISLARYDIGIVQSLGASTICGTPLTDKQSVLAVKLVTKYRRQLNNLGVDISNHDQNSVFRMKVRVVDRSQTATLQEDVIQLRFPYNKELITEIKAAAIESQGKICFDFSNKIWKLGVTENNINWLMVFAKEHNIDVDNTISRYMQMILDAENTPYKIELTLQDNKLVITNAATSLLDYINEHLGGLTLENLLRIVDFSSILGFTINSVIFDLLPHSFNDIEKGILSNREIHVCRHSPDDNNKHLLASVFKYAGTVNRWPVYIYEPDLMYQLKDTVIAMLPPEEFVDLSTKSQLEVDLTRVKCVYLSKIKHKQLCHIPLLVSTNAMLYGAEKQSMLQNTEKIIYYTATTYNKEVKSIASTITN